MAIYPHFETYATELLLEIILFDFFFIFSILSKTILHLIINNCDHLNLCLLIYIMSISISSKLFYICGRNSIGVENLKSSGNSFAADGYISLYD